MTTETLIIPDIHNKIDIADQIAAEQPDVDRVVVLGDVFDFWGDTPRDARRVARWLKSKLDAGWEFVWGNHDLPYAFLHRFPCPGWTLEKHKAISDILTPEDWRKFVPWTWCGPWLLSHAGIHPFWLMDLTRKENESWKEKLRQRIDQLYFITVQDLKQGVTPPILNWCSPIRGGSNLAPGVTWQDWYEFRALDDLPQIVGHTQTKDVRQKLSSNGTPSFCLDSVLRHYAVVDEEGTLRIHYGPRLPWRGCAVEAMAS